MCQVPRTNLPVISTLVLTTLTWSVRIFSVVGFPLVVSSARVSCARLWLLSGIVRFSLICWSCKTFWLSCFTLLPAVCLLLSFSSTLRTASFLILAYFDVEWEVPSSSYMYHRLQVYCCSLLFCSDKSGFCCNLSNFFLVSLKTEQLTCPREAKDFVGYPHKVVSMSDFPHTSSCNMLSLFLELFGGQVKTAEFHLFLPFFLFMVSKHFVSHSTSFPFH